MKKKKIFAALALSACMALGTMSVAACSPNKGNNGGGNTGGTVDKSIMRVYEAYAEAAAANGDDVMDYEEWYADLLANAKGEKGDKGDKGDTGATGAQGEKGDKGDDGDKGEDGAAGKDGNTWLVGTTAPTATDGKDGDLYLDYTTWNVYHKVSGEWQLLGNIKGEKGDKGDKGDSGSQGGEQGEVGETVVKDFGTVTIQAGETYELSFEDIADGTYMLSAELKNGEVVQDGLTATTAYEFNGFSLGSNVFDMYGPKTNSYYCVRIIETLVGAPSYAKTTVLTNNTSAAMTIKVALKEYIAPEVKVGEEVEVSFIEAAVGCAPVAIPSMANGTYDITVKGFLLSKNDNSVHVHKFENAAHNVLFNSFIRDDEGVFTQNGCAIPDGLDFIGFISNVTSKSCNAIVLFEAAA